MESEKIVPPKVTMPMGHEIGLEQTSQEFPEASRRIYVVINHASPSLPSPAANTAAASSGFARGCKGPFRGLFHFRARLIPCSLGWIGRHSASSRPGSTESRPTHCFV